MRIDLDGVFDNLGFVRCSLLTFEGFALAARRFAENRSDLYLEFSPLIAIRNVSVCRTRFLTDLFLCQDREEWMTQLPSVNRLSGALGLIWASLLLISLSFCVFNRTASFALPSTAHVHQLLVVDARCNIVSSV